MSDEELLFEQLRAVYAEVDAEFQGYTCPQSTACCRFSVTGREPYVTSIELAFLMHGLRARGGMLSDKRRALPLLSKQTREQEKTCPLLSDESLCASYEQRPLGCRSFWCTNADDGGTPVRHRAIQGFVRRIKELARQHQRGGEEGRPLTGALAAAIKHGGLTRRGRRRQRHRSS